MTNPFPFPEVRVVEASAGSGKTYALAKRYIQLLLNPKWQADQLPIRNILAITFTNKASFEMKRRILEFLKTIALKKLSKTDQDEILGPIGIDDEDASIRAYQIMESLIRHYNYFQVQTIDKFINALLSGCAFRIGLTANFKIKTNYKEYVERSLDYLIDQAHKDKHVLSIFGSFLHQYLFIENRSGWFPKKDILTILYDLFNQFNAYGLDFQASQFTPDQIIKNKKTIVSDIQSLRSNICEGANKSFLNSLDKFIEKNPESFDIDNISDFFAREAFPATKNAQVPSDVNRLWAKIRKNLKILCEQESQSLFNPYIKIFNQMFEQLKELSAKEDVLFLGELNKMARKLFCDEGLTVGELYYRLAMRFSHYLIDEFQDTSRLQWNNIAMMPEEALANGGSLFYVGDKKQAIYGFRGGDVELFDNIKEEFGAFNVNTELLTKNYRSQKAIVEFNNSIFSQDNLSDFIAKIEEQNKRIEFSVDDVWEIKRVFENSYQSYREEYNKGFVKIEYIDIDRKEERQEIIYDKIVNLIKELKNRFALSDMAILARSNLEIEQLTNYLLAQGINVASERTSNIKENPLIDELIALMEFLNSPINNLAFATFILGDIFAEATPISSEEMHAFLFSIRDHVKNKKDYYIYMAFREKYPEIWNDYFKEFFKNVGLFPLYELIVSILNKFACMEHFNEMQGFLMHFLELVKKQEEEHSDLASFLEYFKALETEEMFVPLGETDAVKILTIHKSKGLQFPVVILPSLNINIKVGASSNNQQSYVVQKDQQEMRLIKLKEKYTKFSQKLKSIYQEEFKQSLICELNNIYVAMTRPQKELYGFIPKKAANSINLARYLVCQEYCQCGSIETYDESAGEEIPLMQMAPSRYQDWIQFLKQEFGNRDEMTNRQQRLKGEQWHYLLSFIGDLSSQNVDEIKDLAFRRLKAQYPHVDDEKGIQTTLDRIIHTKELRSLFYVDGAEVFLEMDIVDAQGQSHRPDRVVKTDKEIIIVDYKLSKSSLGQYEEQVQRYKKVFARMHPKHVVKGYLLYLDTMELEKVS